jgi:shikimate kinase
LIPHRVVLVGFMTSGKTEVGAKLADRLGWRHVDLDLEIERNQGRSVENIFATLGEPAFRALEVRLSDETIADDHIVMSPGGGWVTNEGVLERLPSGTLTVWLKVSPGTVLRRLSAAADQPVRPLLLTPDPKDRIEQLLASREPLYRRARIWIDTDERPVDDIVDLIEDLVRRGTTDTGRFDSSSQHDK